MSLSHLKPALLLALSALTALAGCGDDPNSLIGGGTGRRPLGRAARSSDSGGGAASSGTDTPSTDTGDTPAATGAYAAELQRCVDVTNDYRATLGVPKLARSATLEAFAAKAAASDSQSQQAHGYFSQTRGGGVAFAENAIPGWPMSAGGVSKIVDDGLKMMWNEGPGGGHYENMSSTRYTTLGCGIRVTAANEVWVVQDFR